MQTVRSIAKSARMTLAILLTASLSLPDVLAAGPPGLVIAQGGGFEKLPPSVAPTPYSPSDNKPIAPGLPRVDFVPNPNVNPNSPDRNIPERNPSHTDRSPSQTDRNPDYTDRNPNPTDEPNQNPGAASWGALAFTADGSYSSTWKMPSQPEAEAKVLRQCARFGRGGCEVVSFSGQQCVALATFIGSYRRRRWNLSFTAGGMTYPTAQGAAMDRCNSDERTQGHCQPRTAACADGR
jgi:Domain of unknown function (DUF4189)